MAWDTTSAGIRPSLAVCSRSRRPLGSMPHTAHILSCRAAHQLAAGSSCWLSHRAGDSGSHRRRTATTWSWRSFLPPFPEPRNSTTGLPGVNPPDEVRGHVYELAYSALCTMQRTRVVRVHTAVADQVGLGLFVEVVSGCPTTAATSATSTRSSEAHTPVRRAHNVATDRSRRAEDVLLVGVYRRHVHRADIQRWSDVGAGLCCDVGTC